MKRNIQIPITMDLIKICKRFSVKTRESDMSAYAGQTAYMLILSFFPFIMFLLTLVKYTPLSQEILFSVCEDVFPSSFRNFISGIITGLFSSQSNALIPTTVVAALWLGSKAFLALSTGLNSVYDIEETRNYFILRFFSVIYTLIFAIIIVFSLLVLVFGNALFIQIRLHLPFLEHVLLPLIDMRSIVSFSVMFFFFLILYVNIPNKKMHILDQVPGALLSTTGWMGYSYLYSFYVDHISNYASIYGTMTTIALLMVWLYACMYIVFFGGLLNYIIKECRWRDYLHFLAITEEHPGK